MSAKTLALALVVSVALPLVAGAQTQTPAAPDFAPMTYFVGIWHCTRTKDPDSKLVGTKYSIEGATTRDGNWEILDVPNGEIHIARDAAANRWTWIYLGNGGDYSVMTTPGWIGKTLMLTEVMVYGKAPEGTATFTRQSDMQFTANYSARSSSGDEGYSVRCTRV